MIALTSEHGLSSDEWTLMYWKINTDSFYQANPLLSRWSPDLSDLLLQAGPGDRIFLCAVSDTAGVKLKQVAAFDAPFPNVAFNFDVVSREAAKAKQYYDTVAAVLQSMLNETGDIT